MANEYFHDNYTVGWICALPDELAASRSMLDEHRQDLPTINGDPNAYIFGSIKDLKGVHNVVMACLPHRSTGACPSSVVATHMKSNFKSLRFCLLVGIGGSVPSRTADIRLGDVVVSCPTKDSYGGGVIQFDFGKTVAEGRFNRTGSLNKLPQVLTAAISSLRARQYSQNSPVSSHLETVYRRYPKMKDKFRYQGSDKITSFSQIAPTSATRQLVPRVTLNILKLGNHQLTKTLRSTTGSSPLVIK